jgi:hypothetical protein
MRVLLALAISFLTALPVMAQDTEIALDIRPADEVVLDDFLWLNRLIVVFANTERDPSFREQMELLADRPVDLIDRDVIIVTDTNPSEPSDLRQKLRPRGFGFVLIDKDGVVKLRKPAPWHVREIVRSIDKTELRQQEVRDATEAGE